MDHLLPRRVVPVLQHDAARGGLRAAELLRAWRQAGGHVAPDTRRDSLTMAKAQPRVPVLSNEGREVIGSFSAYEYDVEGQSRELLEAVGNDVAKFNGEGGWILPAPAVFVIDGEGIVHSRASRATTPSGSTAGRGARRARLRSAAGGAGRGCERGSASSARRAALTPRARGRRPGSSCSRLLPVTAREYSQMPKPPRTWAE